MRALMLQGLAAILLLPVLVSGTFVITNPTANSVWTQGNFYDITWTAAKSDPNFRLTIFPYGGGAGVILDDNTSASDLTHNAGIGGNLEVGTWHIAFFLVSDGNDQVAVSPDFKIIAAPSSTSSSLPTSSSVAVSSAVQTHVQSTTSAGGAASVPQGTLVSTPPGGETSSTNSATSSANSVTSSASSATSTTITQTQSQPGTTSSTSTSSSTASPQIGGSNGGGGSDGKSPTGAIVGGVVGGIALLVIIASIALFYLRRRRGLRNGNYEATAMTETPSMESKHAGSNSSAVGIMAPKSEMSTETPITAFNHGRLYNYDDPSTWPPPLSPQMQAQIQLPVTPHQPPNYPPPQPPAHLGPFV